MSTDSTRDDEPTDALVLDDASTQSASSAEPAASSSLSGHGTSRTKVPIPPNWWRDMTGRPRLFWRLCLLGLVFLATQVWGGVVVVAVMFGVWAASGGMDAGSAPGGNPAEAFANWLSSAHLSLLVLSAFIVTPVLFGLVVLLRRFVDQRSVRSLGFQRANSWLVSVLAGVAYGLLLIGGATGVVIACGGYSYEISTLPWQVPALIPVLVLAAFQEEFLIRGYVLRNYVDIERPWTGLVVSSLIFWLLHGMNPAAWVSPWVGVNLILAGWLLGLMYLLSGNLWFPTAVHFAWNFAQGPLLGIPVSGIRMPSWIHMTVQPDSPHWLTGGDFGLEGSAVCAAIQLAIIACMTILHLRLSPAKLVPTILLGVLIGGIMGRGPVDAAEPAPPAVVQRIGVDPVTRTSRGVVVPRTPLAHTAQLLPVDVAGRLASPGDVEAQAARVFENLSIALRAAQADVKQLVKLNVYVADTAHTATIERFLAERLATGHEPAVSYVTTRLPVTGALVAMDAVAAAPASNPTAAENATTTTPLLRRAPGLAGAPRMSHVAVLPPGSRIYVAGQAEKGDLATATRLTLESLRRTLEFLEQSDADIVQFKSFIKPMSDVAVAEAEFAAFFRDRAIQPLVFVEWESSLPIEIELIAAAKAPPDGAKPPAIEYLTPPGMTTSPVYSRVARAHGPQTAYFAGLYARSPGDGAAQVNDIFAQLTDLATASGTDLKHLAKATYYVTDDDASRKLNELRPKYYDPKSPPAASKAQVRGSGRLDRTITLDMIAVP